MTTKRLTKAEKAKPVISAARERSHRWAKQVRVNGPRISTQRDLEPVNASQAAHDRADLLDFIDALLAENEALRELVQRALDHHAPSWVDDARALLADEDPCLPKDIG